MFKFVSFKFLIKNILIVFSIISFTHGMEQKMGPTPKDPSPTEKNSCSQIGKCLSNWFGDIFCGYDSSVVSLEIFPHNPICRATSTFPCCWVMRLLAGDRGIMPACLCRICSSQNEDESEHIKFNAQQNRIMARTICLSLTAMGGCVTALAV